jgi:hypothetical protein
MFFIGFHNSLYETFLPQWLGDFFMIPAAAYFIGGGLIIPVGWFVYVVYHYQVSQKMMEEQFKQQTKQFICKQYFPLAILVNYLINLVYLLIIGKVNSFDVVHFVGFLLLILSLISLDFARNKTLWTLFYALGGVFIVIWFSDIVISGNFKQAILEQSTLIYGISYQTAFYLVWIFTVFVAGYAVVGFFYIPNRKKYHHLLFLVISLMLMFLNVVRQLDIFSQLRIG